MGTKYTFEPKTEVADWIDENIPSWTKFCYDNIYYSQKRDFYERINKLSNKFAYVLIGCILLSLTYIVPFLPAYLVFFFSGAFFIVYGFSSFSWEVKNGRRNKHT